MSDGNKHAIRLDGTPLTGVTLGPYYRANDPELTVTPNEDQIVRVKVNKQTHRVRFDSETENEVTVAIEPMEKPDGIRT